MANELWYHGSYGLSRDVHPTARVEIPTGADSEFITEYLTNDGRYIRIICQYSVNRSVQVTGIPEVWGSASDSLPYITNATITAEKIGWGLTDTYSNSNSSTATGR